MAEVFFYHLTESTLDEALPELVEKSVARGWRAVIQTGTEELRDELDAHLWTYRAESFLPHATDGGEFAENAANQPILLTVSAENENRADIRFLVGEAVPPGDIGEYKRVVVMFDGLNEDSLAAARDQWKDLKVSGHDLTYWQQNQDGRWERKA